MNVGFVASTVTKSVNGMLPSPGMIQSRSYSSSASNIGRSKCGAAMIGATRPLANQSFGAIPEARRACCSRSA